MIIDHSAFQRIPMPYIAAQYFEEARLCYYCGPFIATIFMVHAAFEELLRSHYRTIRGIKANLSCDKSVDDADFVIIDETTFDGYITRN